MTLSIPPLNIWSLIKGLYIKQTKLYLAYFYLCIHFISIIIVFLVSSRNRSFTAPEIYSKRAKPIGNEGTLEKVRAKVHNPEVLICNGLQPTSLRYHLFLKSENNVNPTYSLPGSD